MHTVPGEVAAMTRLLRRLRCYLLGHRWSAGVHWEFTNGTRVSDRYCQRCGLPEFHIDRSPR